MNLLVMPITSKAASDVVVREHYLHRRPPISFAFGLLDGLDIIGVCTYGTPASRHLQIGACPSDPGAVLELNRLWVHDAQPRNTESWFVSRTLRQLPARLIVSYADPAHGHVGHIYRALSWHYAGWTDMDRKTPSFDYVPTDPTKHSRQASRDGITPEMRRVRRIPKVRYWTTTGSRTQRQRLERASGWGVMDWHATPPPMPPVEAA